MATYEPTPRTQVKRLPKRGVYDREQVHAILDEAFLCHIGFVDDGAPVVIPTAFGRDGEKLYFHGSAASRMLRAAAKGIPLCLTVTHVDGLVLARSAFHHSINYRSVVVFGTARLVDDLEEKMHALRVISEQIIAGRWDHVREPNAQEMKATSVLCLSLEEVSAKVRTGGPVDDEEDMALPVWAGVLPFVTTAGAPVADAGIAGDAPDHVTQYKRPKRG
jgi:nitroimidazol reductase NimA-like FMN-containing flavoprotein (pyridoxamine 5'-phosphate oxidase superfamily)